MLTLSLLFTVAIALLVGIVFGAVVRDNNTTAEVRISFVLLLMLCISSMVMLGGASMTTLATYFGVSTVVGIVLQFIPQDNSIVRRISDTLG